MTTRPGTFGRSRRRPDGNQLRVFYDFNWEMSEERRRDGIRSDAFPW